MGKKPKDLFAKSINIKNKKAAFEYEFIEKFTAGIALTGTEIKSVRMGKVSLADSFCYIRSGEVYIKNMHIAHYSFGNIHNHDETRDRKLLLTRREVDKLMKAKDKGITIIPYRVFISERGFAKVEICLARGKKTFDKRQSIKERDIDRQQRRELSEK